MTAAELAEKLEAVTAEQLDTVWGGMRLLDNFRQAAARLRSMEEALRPFADWADHHRASTHDHYVPECEIDGPGHSLTITLGEFRKARAVLSGEGQ